MMKVLVSVLTVLLLSIGLIGCSSSDISLVKNGTLDFNKSLTVGQAIDRFQYFTRTKWEILTTPNGKKVVQATGVIDIAKHLTINPIKNPGLKEAYMQFQFVVNVDKTFELAWCGFGLEKDNGENIAPQQQINLMLCLNSLKAVYDNSPDI